MKKYFVLIILSCILSMSLLSQSIKSPLLMSCSFEDSTFQKIYKEDLILVKLKNEKSEIKHFDFTKPVKILNISNDSLLLSNEKRDKWVSTDNIHSIQLVSETVTISAQKKSISGLTIAGIVLSLLGGLFYFGGKSNDSEDGCLQALVGIPIGLIGIVLTFVGLATHQPSKKNEYKIEGKELRFEDPRCHCKNFYIP